jgi:hypothetical protein
VATRTLASLTAADLDKSIVHDKLRGAIKAIRHFRIESGTATPHGTYTAVVIKVPVPKPGDIDHREIWELADTEVEVS